MKKVLTVITTAFVPTGGLTTVMMNYYRVLDKTSVHIDFASTNDPPQILLNEIYRNQSKYFKLPQRKRIVQYLLALKKIAVGYDVIHVHGNSSSSFIELLAARLAGVKKRIVHNHNSRTSHPMLNRILHPLFSRSYTCAIACSEKAGDWLFERGEFQILKNAIDISRFSTNETARKKTRTELNIPEDAFVVGHIGKFVKAKNHVFLLQVFAELKQLRPNIRLLLVGDGVLRSDIENEIARLGLESEVILAGLRTDTPEMLSAMDVFAFPSLWEGLPLSVLEAQAAGLPCLLSTNISKEVVASEMCIQMELNMPKLTWAKTLLSISQKTNRRELSLSNYASLSDAGYNIAIAASSLEKIYLE